MESISVGQWDGGASLGLRYLDQLRLVILPQATRIAIPLTVGFLVQLVKSTILPGALRGGVSYSVVVFMSKRRTGW